ncbi:MAG TPA: NAD(P)/FAD-dependent oxidoreductase [Thermoanaerobaculia bacterium]|nr:NAD(P)/FAD-dependent oxidoreductase [Thermoanaerobaculia bacterium]
MSRNQGEDIHPSSVSLHPSARVVILGGGFGGLYAAKALKRAPTTVTIVDRRNFHLFQPLLYQVATAALNPSDIAHPIRSVVARQKNTSVILGEAKAIDLNRKVVALADSDVAYDYLIVATGSTHSYFGHPEWERDAPGLKTIEDALEIRRRVLLAFESAERESDREKQRAWLTFVIVGAGPTGVELAGALSEIARHTMLRDFRTINPSSARVVLLEGKDRVLPTYPPDLSMKAEKQLRELGVEVITSAMVTRVDSTTVEMEHRLQPVMEKPAEAGAPSHKPAEAGAPSREPAEAGAPLSIATHTVLWAAGVQASPLAKTLGVPLDRAGRVLVNDDLTVPGHPEVYVIGDLATLSRPVPGVAPAAIQEGEHAAKNIERAIRGKPPLPFHYFDKGSLATIGRAAAVADFGRIHIAGFPAWFAWLAVHIFFLIGFRNRVLVILQWAWAYLTYERGARLITGKEAT